MSEVCFMDQIDAQRLRVLLESAAKTTYDANKKLWDEVLTVLTLDLCYQPTIAEVLRGKTWRNAANPRAYIASAAVRAARRKELPDYSEKEFRRVSSDEPNGDVGTRIDSGAGFDLEDWGGGGVYQRTASGAIRYVDSYDDVDDRQIPGWLQRGEEHDAVDWETVAVYAVLKPRMACLLARVLIYRLDRRLGRAEAMARAENDDEAAAIEAAWKWIDRNRDDRIAPLFKMAGPPRPLTSEDIASFPLLVPGVSLRLDVELHREGNKRRFVLARDGAFPVYWFKTKSEKAAMDELRKYASEGDEEEDSDIFHFWPIQSAINEVETPKRSKQEILSRVGAR
jgi:hypothetical protein